MKVGPPTTTHDLSVEPMIVSRDELVSGTEVIVTKDLPVPAFRPLSVLFPIV